MEAFALDTSGYVQCPAPDQKPNESTGCWFWDDLSPFAQGYIDALFASLWDPVFQKPVLRSGPIDFRGVAFRHFAPETLADILADCDRYCREWGWDDQCAEIGGDLWRDRQQRFAGWPRADELSEDFPPVTLLYLGDDGLIYQREGR